MCGGPPPPKRGLETLLSNFKARIGDSGVESRAWALGIDVIEPLPLPLSHTLSPLPAPWYAFLKRGVQNFSGASQSVSCLNKGHPTIWT